MRQIRLVGYGFHGDAWVSGVVLHLLSWVILCTIETCWRWGPVSFLWLQLLVSGCEGSVRESVCFKGMYLDVVLSLRTSRRQGLCSSLSCCCAVWIGCGCGWVGWSWWWVSSEFLGGHFSFRWVGTPWRCLGALYFILVDRF